MVSKGAVALLACGLMALAGCGEKQVSPPTAPKTAEALQDTSAPASVPAASHEYASREGDVFYYHSDDGTLIGAKDLGRLPANQDFSGLLKQGDRAVQFDGRTFAAVSPGSDVVRISRNIPGEQILRPVANVPLSGDSAAAKALRDSLAGRLTFPSESALDAQARNSDERSLSAEAGDDAVSNARPDDYDQ